MRQKSSLRHLSIKVLTVITTLVFLLCSPVTLAAPAGGDGNKASLTAQQAAKRAQSRHGGKVLKVSRSKSGYRVKLLLDSGRVTTVTITSRQSGR